MQEILDDLPLSNPPLLFKEDSRPKRCVLAQLELSNYFSFNHFILHLSCIHVDVDAKYNLSFTVLVNLS